MLKIRLQRTGRKNLPFYRIVVAEHSTRVKGSYIERIGQYNPISKPKEFVVDESKVEEWIKKGAKPSSTMARLLKGHGMKNMEAYIEDMPDRKKKKQQTAEESTAPKEKAEGEGGGAPAGDKPVDDKPAEAAPDSAPEEAPKEEPKPEEPKEAEGEGGEAEAAPEDEGEPKQD